MNNLLTDKQIKGKIFNIQRYCTHDGPGIRTTVFFKGCPIRCAWCHNPESHDFCEEIGYNSNACIKCGKCIQVCLNNAHVVKDGKHVFDRQKCKRCFKCVEECPSALEKIGREMTVKEVLDEVMEDKMFYKELGGITLSGGEPLSQSEFSYELLKGAKELGITTAVETCGFVKYEILEKIAPYVDLFLYDYKITDSALHKKYIGVDNTLILENLFKLDESGAKIVLRCPIIPNINDNDEHFEGIIKVANSLKNLVRVEIEPAHILGNSKYSQFGYKTTSFDYRVPTDEEVLKWIEKIQVGTSVLVKKS